jgi:hypothetical protein
MVSFGWLEALWFLVLFPLVVWGVIVVAAYLFGHRGGLRPLLLAAATGAAPVVAMAHLAKAAAKMTSWGGFLPLALGDPSGVDTLRRIAERSTTAPAAMAGLTALGWTMLVLVLVMGWKTWRWARQIPVASMIAAQTGLAGAAILFATVLGAWAWPGL